VPFHGPAAQQFVIGCDGELGGGGCYVEEMKRPSLRQIAAVFFRHGNWTFGGGNATIAALQRELLERKAWVGREEVSLSYALARLTPGTNLLSFCAGMGWLLRGLSGALVVLVAGSIPSSMLAVLVTALYESWSRNRFVTVGVRGAMAAAVGIMIATGWTLIRPHWKSASLVRVMLFAGGALALGLGSVAPMRVMAAAAILGVLWPQREAA
jgi:chromate transporter